MKKVLSLLSLLALMPSGSMLLAEGKACSSELIGQAEAANKEAIAHNNEWRDTAKLIKESKKACDEGDMKKSDQLASKARLQGHRAVEQAEFMDKNWEIMIPKH